MRVLITGTSRGLGRALAQQLDRGGHEVVAAQRNLSDASPAVGLRPVELDVTSEASIATATSQLTRLPLDILVNNAGGYDADSSGYLPGQQMLGALNQTEALRLYAVNAIGPLLMTQALLGCLRLSTRPGGALVINVSSLVGSIAERTTGGDHYYGPTKAALNWTTKTLAAELAPLISVVAVTPGWVATRTGGPQAPGDVQWAAEKMTRLIETLDVTTSGRFLDVDGNEIPW